MKVEAFFLAALLAVSPCATAAWEYNGFVVDDSLLDAEQKTAFAAEAAPSLKEQLAIVERVGLPPEMLAFFKQTKIRIDPALRGNPGVFSVQNGEGQITIRPVAFPGNRPILLHELMHAYHFAVASLRNPAILAGFDAASRAGVYPAAFQRAHFLENPKEFFAVTSTIYLFGQIQQPPFNCEGIAKNDPLYLAFLEKTFGRHDCH
jgi:hypothetical protein